MAKHPHKFILINNRTWKCALEGCTFFVHLGLAHVLVGKHAVCWNCEETFVVDELSLKDGKPKCIDCRLALGHSVQSDQVAQSDSVPTNNRTPEQQRAYEKEMAQMFGQNWREMLK